MKLKRTVWLDGFKLIYFSYEISLTQDFSGVVSYDIFKENVFIFLNFAAFRLIEEV